MLISDNQGRSTAVWLSPASLVMQLVIIALTAYFIPLVAPLLIYGDLAERLISTSNSQAISLSAAVVALFTFRRVTIYPGARAFSFIVPAFSITFGIATVALLLLRVPYSGPMLLTGYVATVGMSFLLVHLDRRAEPRRLFYVPFGKTDIVSDTPDIDWLKLEEPCVPADRSVAIVADLRFTHLPDWERMLAEAAITGVPVYHTKQLRESLTGRVQIEHLSENSFGSLLPALGYKGVKRTVDFVSSVVLLPILFLPMLIVAILVRVSSPGAILFRQRRMGYRGEPFEMLKFRTMFSQEAMAQPSAEREAAITRHEDDRVTSVGRFLRKSRIDELPQIMNILRGEMSWIGPRPEAVPLSEWYEHEIPFYRYRHIVRPGITGWAQVNQGHVAEIDDVSVKLNFDFYYVKFFSFWLDVVIALRTVAIMFTGFGAK